MFASDDLTKAIQSALSAPDLIPPGKKLALVAIAQADGTVKAAIAYKVGGHWQAGGEVEWHGGAIDGVAKVQASW